MRAGFSNRFNYSDPLLKKRRRRALTIIVFVACCGFLTLVGGTYAMLFSSAFAIQEVKIEGLRNIPEELVRAYIQDEIQRVKFHYIPWGRNILFFNSRRLVQELLRKNPELKAATINKEYFHTIMAKFQERQAVGIWCFTGGNCVYFDEQGDTWGNAVPSSGSLIAVVHDERPDVDSLDKDFLDAIRLVIPRLIGMELGVKRVQISKDAFGDFSIFTSADVPVILSLDSDITGQLNVLKIFLDQRAPPNWKPAYIDLRINGRIYFK